MYLGGGKGGVTLFFPCPRGDDGRAGEAGLSPDDGVGWRMQRAWEGGCREQRMEGADSGG